LGVWASVDTNSDRNDDFCAKTSGIVMKLRIDLKTTNWSLV